MSAEPEVWHCGECRGEFSPAFVLLDATAPVLLQFSLCATCYRAGRGGRSIVWRIALTEEEWRSMRAGGLATWPPTVNGADGLRRAVAR